MNKTKTIFLLSVILLQSMAIASLEHYKSTKSEIDRLESSVIANFNFVIPQGYVEKFETSLQSTLTEELEMAWSKQVKLFEVAESKLYKIGKSLDQEVQAGKLTEAESKKLMTYVEYARRIIIESRKKEVIQQYSEFKEQLLVKPTIQHLFSKITNVKLPGSCKIQDVHLDGNFLTFEVLGVGKKGEELTHNYAISKTDVDLGSLTTSSTHEIALADDHKSILSFRVTENDLSLKKFNLFENKEGEFYHAEFIHEDIKSPMFTVLGLNIGEKKKSEEIFCNLYGTKPASLEELQREKIKESFDNQALISNN